MPRYLEQRRRRWYAVMDVPKELRDHFGKPRLVKSLGTESRSEAERLVLPIVAAWKAQVAAIRSGDASQATGLFEKALEWREDYARSRGEERSDLNYLLEEEAERIARKTPEIATSFKKVVLGQSYPTLSRLDQWIGTLRDTPKTQDMKRAIIQRFAERFPFTDAVTRTNVQRWAHRLQQSDGLSVASVNKFLSACRGYWGFLILEGVVEEASAEAFRAVGPKKAAKTKAARSDQRRPFAPSDLIKLLEAAKQAEDRPLGQLIWLGMWTGCRIEELCGLRTAEVQHGCLAVGDAKSEAGDRTVPIHSKLLPLVSHLCATSRDGYLLSGLTFNKYGDRSNAIGKRFGRLKDGLGFGPQHVFHSIRKTVATELQNRLVPEPISADILGHDKPTMTYGLYSGGAHVEVMREALEKLDYPVEGTPAWLLQP